MTAEAVEKVLSHYGKLGMRWGVRNDRSSAKGGMSTKKKVAVGAGVAAVGALAVAGVLYKNKQVKMSEVRKASSATYSTVNKYGKSTYGSEAAKAFTKEVWSTPVSKFTPGPSHGQLQSLMKQLGVTDHGSAHKYIQWSHELGQYVPR